MKPGWKMVKLGEVVSIKGGGTPSRKNDAYWNGDIPWASVKDFKSEKLEKTIEFITAEGLSKSASNLIPKDTIIIPTRMALGKVAINSIPLAINQDLKALFVIDDSNLDKRYLAKFLQSKASHIEENGSGATVKGITLDFLRGLQIPLPPLGEQRRIVAVLDAAQELIDKRKEQLALMDQLTQSLFYTMFGDYYSDQSCYHPLGAVTKFIDYRGKTPSRVESGVPLINAKCVRRGYFDPARIDYIEQDTYQKIMTRGFPKGNEVLFTTEGATMGFVTRIPKDFQHGKFAVGQRLITLRCGEILTSEYLDFILNDERFQSEVFKRATGSAAKGIRSKELALIMIPISPLALQQEFAERVAAIEREKAAMSSALKEQEDLFAALMQRAFSNNE